MSTVSPTRQLVTLLSLGQLTRQFESGMRAVTWEEVSLEACVFQSSTQSHIFLDSRVVSHSSQPSNNLLSPTAFSGRPIPISYLKPDGWVHGVEGPLFWVPEDYRNGLTCPAIMTNPNTGRNRCVRLDFSRFQYGTSWTNIRGMLTWK